MIRPLPTGPRRLLWLVAILSAYPAFFLLGLVLGWGPVNPHWYARPAYWLLGGDVVLLVVALVALGRGAGTRGDRPEAARTATPAVPPRASSTTEQPRPAEPDGLAVPEPVALWEQPSLAESGIPDGPAGEARPGPAGAGERQSSRRR